MSTTNATDAAAKAAVNPIFIWPSQCSCGHIYLERYKFGEPTDENNIGFCWCGFCETKRMVKAI